nr:immunoglobulin heavy chain junction region [Macaca mulatta]MPN83287.1 immunoglobulin heavy chain junction region [Macaca mulatta]MPN83288.1 immunoglobulin heavy chain junction region [Macaca mulatta]MPN83296.1 immunoglobulin heavy chain junction region [Macaca mulatta]MPN83303.1 immunoglobulin heavy chain junction region [Macaca mulatta]
CARDLQLWSGYYMPFEFW